MRLKRTVALLFAGQGADEPRMGLGVAEQSAQARALLDRAGAAAGVDALALLRRGGSDLDRTEVLQPLLAAVCLGALRALRPVLDALGWEPACVAGHSVGELSAWAAAGALSCEDAVDVAAARGRLMAREAALHPGGMLALIDAGEEAAAEALAIGQRHGPLELAAVNSPRERVVSGGLPALEAVAARVPGRRLRVAGAWHSAAMAGAVAELRTLLERTVRSPLKTRLVANQTGDFVQDSARLPELLSAQLTRPVQWATTLQTLAAAGVTDVITVGPGRLLRALTRQNGGAWGTTVRIHAAAEPGDLRRLQASEELS